MSNFPVRLFLLAIISIAIFVRGMLSSLGTLAQIEPTAQQETIDAIIVERFNQTATAQSAMEATDLAFEKTLNFYGTVEAAFNQAQIATAAVIASSTQAVITPTGTNTPTPTPVFPTVMPVTPLPTLEFSLVPANSNVATVGALPRVIGPGMSAADFSVPAASDDLEPFLLTNPIDPDQSVVLDEFGAMYWHINDERRPLPEPFSSFGPDSLENSDRVVRAAAWSPDGAAVAFVVDNPRHGDANDGVWWWEVGTGRAYQVMHNCRRNIRNCDDFVNAVGDPYINPPADQPEQPNTGWYAVSVSWSPDGTRILARLRIREDQRLAFIILPATMDDNWKRQRGDICNYELSDWSADGSAVIVAGRDSNEMPVLGRLDKPTTCSGYIPLPAEAVIDTRVTPVGMDRSSDILPDGVIAGSEYIAGQQVQVYSGTGGLNLRTRPVQSAAVHRYVLNGEYVRVLAGPYDVEGYRWWKVQTAEGTQGWMAGTSRDATLLVPVPD